MIDGFEKTLDKIKSEKDSFKKIEDLIEKLVVEIKKDINTKDLKLELQKTKVTKDELREALIESMTEARISKLLTSLILLLFIHQFEPDAFTEELEKLEQYESKGLLLSPSEVNIGVLVGTLYNIAKKKMVEASRKRNLQISSKEQDIVFEQARKILKEYKKKNFHCTKKEAIYKSNEELNYLIPKMDLKNNINDYENRFKQFERSKGKGKKSKKLSG